MSETVTAAIVASAAALAVACVFVVQSRRARSDQRFEIVLAQLDRHMSTISQSLQRVVERAADARARGVDDLELTVDFDELLRRIATDAATRTGAEAAAVQVQGPGEGMATATFGDVDRAEPLEAPLAHAAGPFRAVTMSWTYRPGGGRELDPFTSALVVPIAEHGVESGALAVYAPEPGVFGPGHVQALEALAAEAVPAIASARRYAEAQRAMTDPLTGLRNSKGYEFELERAVERARETGQPLSLVILERDNVEADQRAVDDPRIDLALHELAGLLARLTRSTDVVCLRGDRQFAIVLPHTAGDSARRFYGRLREEASRTPFSVTRELTIAAGVVEWRPNELGEAFDARASAALGQQRVEALELVATDVRRDRDAAKPETRHGLEERLAQAIVRSRELDQRLTVLVVDLEGLRDIEARHGARTAERVLTEVESRVAPSLEENDMSSRIGEQQFAVILTDSTADRAESVFAALQASLEAQPATDFDRLEVAGGITEFSPADDVDSTLARAEQAVVRAKRAGHGTVVVAMAADDTRN